MNDQILKHNIEQMVSFLYSFDLEESYLAGEMKRTGEFWRGSTMDVGEFWMTFVLCYYDRPVDDPWSLNIDVVASDHTSFAGAHRAASQQDMITFLESQAGFEELKARIKKLAKDEAGFYWP